MLVKLEPQPIEAEADSDDLILLLFLDLVTKDALTNPEHLEAYTEEMADKDDKLLAGVIVHCGTPRNPLFFRTFSNEERQVLIVLWLSYPWKAGDKRDCYKIFTKIVGNGDFPDSLQELLMATD